MPGHPDWDASVVWRAPDLYAQVSGNYPAAGTVLFEGPNTNYPALQIYIQPSAGGVRLRVNSYTDSSKAILVGNDIFDATSNTGQLCVYEQRGAWMRIAIEALTTSPAGAGAMAITPTRAPANEIRGLVTPQFIALNSVSIPAGQTNNYYFNWALVANANWQIIVSTPSNAVQATLEELEYNGVVLLTHFGPANLVAGAAQNHYLTGFPLHLKLTNSATVAATVTMTLISQQQGW